jgi:hypothetical protein
MQLYNEIEDCHVSYDFENKRHTTLTHTQRECLQRIWLWNKLENQRPPEYFFEIHSLPWGLSYQQELNLVHFTEPCADFKGGLCSIWAGSVPTTKPTINLMAIFETTYLFYLHKFICKESHILFHKWKPKYLAYK